MRITNLCYSDLLSWYFSKIILTWLGFKYFLDSIASLVLSRITITIMNVLVCLTFSKNNHIKLKKFLIRISWISLFQLTEWQNHRVQTLLKLQDCWKQCFVSTSLSSHVETGGRPVLSCPTNLIILRNLFLTYRESDINSRVFSLDCYQSYRGGPSCHTGLLRTTVWTYLSV